MFLEKKKKSKDIGSKKQEKEKGKRYYLYVPAKGRWSSGEIEVWGWQENWLRTIGTEGQRLRGHEGGR